MKYNYYCHRKIIFCLLVLIYLIICKLRTFLLLLFFLFGNQPEITCVHFFIYFFSFWQPANHGARPNVAKYVIVLTDGRSNDNSKTVQAAMALHNVPNVTVIAIGIGHAIDVNELHIIATDRNHSFVVNNFDLLHTLEVELVDKTCSRELSPFD